MENGKKMYPVRRLHDLPVSLHELRTMQPQLLFFGFHEVRKVFLCHPITAYHIVIFTSAPRFFL